MARWWVTFEADPKDHASLENVTPDQQSGTVIRGDYDGNPELAVMFEVESDSQQVAFDDAVELYGMARAAAGLDPAPATKVTLYRVDRPREEQTFHQDWYLVARDHLAEGRPNEAVLIGQVACETLIRGLFPDLVLRTVPTPMRQAVIDAMHNWNLTEKRSRRLWDAIAQDAIGSTSWWTEYHNHVRRRNHLVHFGFYVTEAEAGASLAAVDAFLDTSPEH